MAGKASVSKLRYVKLGQVVSIDCINKRPFFEANVILILAKLSTGKRSLGLGETTDQSLELYGFSGNT